MKKLIFILFLFVSYLIHATDSNYYVDNTGTGDTLATIAEVNALSLAADDSIFFKKGCVWRETLTIPNSGTSGHNIVFTNYGTGDNPQILGSTQAITWSDEGDNVWSSATAVTDPYGTYYQTEIFFDESGVITWGVHKANTGALAAEYDWTWSANTVYVYAASDPDDRYTAVEVPQRDDAIHLNSKQYLEFNGIDLFYTKIDGIVETYKTGGYTGLIVRNCEIAYIDRKNGDGFGIEAVYNNSLIENNEIHDCGRRGLSFQNYGTEDISGIIIQNNTFYNGFHTTSLDMSTGSIAGATGSIENVIFRNNIIYDDPDRTGQVSNLVFIANVTVYTGVTTITNVYIYNNIFKGGTVSLMAKETSDSYIYNNTFYGLNQNTEQPQDICHLNFYTDCENITIKNNIFYGDVDNETNYIAPAIILDTGQDWGDFTVDYNLYFMTDATQYFMLKYGTGAYTMAQWATYKSASGYDANSPTPVDPSFTDAPTDLTLAEGSPAIGTGIGVGITTDYNGDAVNDPPDIGAYAYDSAPVEPPPVPIVTTEILSHTAVYAIVQVTVTDVEGTVSDRGVTFSLTANPTVTDRVIKAGSGTGTFRVHIPIVAGVTFHVRGWAINQSGTSYGSDQTVTGLNKSVGLSDGNVGTINGKPVKF